MKGGPSVLAGASTQLSIWQTFPQSYNTKHCIRSSGCVHTCSLRISLGDGASCSCKILSAAFALDITAAGIPSALVPQLLFSLCPNIYVCRVCWERGALSQEITVWHHGAGRTSTMTIGTCKEIMHACIVVCAKDNRQATGSDNCCSDRNVADFASVILTIHKQGHPSRLYVLPVKRFTPAATSRPIV